MCCFNLGYVLSDFVHCRVRSAYVYNWCLTGYGVLLIPRVTQAWNTVVFHLLMYFTARQTSIVDIGGTSATVE